MQLYVLRKWVQKVDIPVIDLAFGSMPSCHSRQKIDSNTWVRGCRPNYFFVALEYNKIKINKIINLSYRPMKIVK